MTARLYLAALAATAVGSALFVACTDAHLYGLGQEDTTPDRLGVTGTVCTSDAEQAGFPIRVVLLVDKAAGPLFASYDPEALRLAALRDTVQLHAGNDDVSFAVIGMGGTARLLAPTDGTSFTRDPGALDGAIATLGVAEGCIGTVCRDLDGALDLTEALVRSDIQQMDAGDRLRTQVAIVYMAAGPPDPLACASDCCTDDTCADTGCTESWGCTDSLYSDRIQALRQSVEADGALALGFHVVQLGALDTSLPDPLGDRESTTSLYESMAFAGQGSFQRFDVADSISLDQVGLLRMSSVLQVKGLLVSNENVMASPSGPLLDSDGDGLPDQDEATIGTAPDLADTDADYVNDRVELLVSRDPLTAEPLPAACELLDESPPYPDPDVDGLDDCAEALLGTDSTLTDTDGDGMPDGTEVLTGTDYLHPDDLDDADGDGITNGDETLAHTDPRTADAGDKLGIGYRAEIKDLGRIIQPLVHPPLRLTGVTIANAGIESTPGLGTLRYQLTPNKQLSWQDAGDTTPGPWVDVKNGSVRLDSSSVGAADLERWIDVDVDTASLPADPSEEMLLVEQSDRQCIDYTVRNIRVADTVGAANGENGILVYFAESPEGRLAYPALYRVAHIPVTFDSTTQTRDPSAPILTVDETEFVQVPLP